MVIYVSLDIFFEECKLNALMDVLEFSFSTSHQSTLQVNKGGVAAVTSNFGSCMCPFKNKIKKSFLDCSAFVLCIFETEGDSETMLYWRIITFGPETPNYQLANYIYVSELMQGASPRLHCSRTSHLTYIKRNNWY